MGYMAEYSRKDTSDTERTLKDQNAKLRTAVSTLVQIKELHPSMKQTIGNYRDVNNAIKKYNKHAEEANKLLDKQSNAIKHKKWTLAVKLANNIEKEYSRAGKARRHLNKITEK